MEMDSYEGDKEETLSLHKYIFGESDPVNQVDPRGNDSNTVGPAETALLQGILPIQVNLDYPLLSLDLRQIVGVVFAESGTSSVGFGENFEEKVAMGLVFENRVYYRNRYPTRGNRRDFGDGTVIDAIKKGSGAYTWALTHPDAEWNLIMSNNDLKSESEVEKNLTTPAARIHFNASVKAAYELVDITFPASSISLIDPLTPPVAFNSSTDRMKWLGFLGSHNFYGFKEGREAR